MSPSCAGRCRQGRAACKSPTACQIKTPGWVAAWLRHPGLVAMVALASFFLLIWCSKP